MPTFTSNIEDFGAIALPGFTGVRVMMQPFDLADVRGSLPNLPQWHGAIEAMRERSSVKDGIAYLTIDEAEVKAGECHRRPGLHVDGVGPDGYVGGWGGGGGSWGRNGMIVAASHVGCRGWAQVFAGAPGPDGDCSHLSQQARAEACVTMAAKRMYWCGPLALHESIPLSSAARRQFVRLSMPSTAPWYEGYTPSPVGIMPTGPIMPRRAGMNYRPSPVSTC